jgi:hypothetical protein
MFASHSLQLVGLPTLREITRPSFGTFTMANWPRFGPSTITVHIAFHGPVHANMYLLNLQKSRLLFGKRCLLSLLYAPIDLYSDFASSRGQLVSLICSTTLTLEWICQIGFWTNCELRRDDNSVQPWCPRYAMRTRLGRGLSNTPAQRAKFVLGYITAFT